VKPKPFKASPLAAIDAQDWNHEAAIKEQLSNSPSMTLMELQSWLEHEQSLSISIPAIDKFIRHKLGYRYKKNAGRQ
jgi:transposase